jgi:hypothetical protein
LIFTGHHHGLSDVLQREQRQLDLWNIDAVATDLHLKILTPQVFETVVCTQTSQIPVAVDTCSPAFGGRREGLRGALRLTPIAGGKITTLDHDLADLIHSDLCPGLIEQEDLAVLSRIANRDHVASELRRLGDEVLPDWAGRHRRDAPPTASEHELVPMMETGLQNP